MIPSPQPMQEKRSLKERLERLPALCRAVFPALWEFLLFFLTPFIRIFEIPSPFAAALLPAAPVRPGFFSLFGLALSLLLRFLWQIPADLWQYAGCALLWLFLRRKRPSTDIRSALYTLAALLPRTVAACIRGTPWDVILSVAALPMGMLTSFVLHHCFEEWSECYAQPRVRERLGVQLVCLILIAALGFFRIGVVNLGQLLAMITVVLAARTKGSTYGASAGLLCSLVLVMDGHDYRLVLPLCLCGLLSGLRGVAGLAVPLLTTVACLLTGCITPAGRQPIHWLCGLAGGLICLLLPRGAQEKADLYLSGTLPGSAGMENDFVSQRISHMREAVEEIARVLPRPYGGDIRDSEALGALLCSACSNREACWNHTRSSTENMLNHSMELARDGLAINMQALPALKQHGCLRAEAIEETARQAMVTQKKRRYRQRRAEYEQTLTMTHLNAMSGTLAELCALAAGQSVSDLQAAHVILLALDELRIPARLCYARRVDGHLMASLEMNSLLPGRKAIDQLLQYLEENEGLSLFVTRIRHRRIDLEETPVYSAEIGTASMGAGGSSVCGDACMYKTCEGGRLLMMLCDGMGHGEEAHAQSQKTLELLKLLLEAGYNRRQAITAVNGIMLSAYEGEERFTTVDLCDVDLWSGYVCCEKLGACATWVVRGDHLKKVEASSLPLGILEEAKPCHVEYTLHSGDILILMSDGVAEAFRDEEDLKHAILESLYIQPQRMADALLRHALLAGGEQPRDDMTVMILMLLNRQHLP
ncbi:MAG: SpoIIE family protein phosphatase [Clostridia bacterium]|nr:SpoIIE family protein phosphatase [Clostridia bacterium]